MISQVTLFDEPESMTSQSYRGGFPCQPHSLAGKRGASSDERDLWPEYKRIIRETSPKWIVGENVVGILSSESGRFFGGILRDLAELGFDVGWCSIRASWVGAVHQRERVFIVAHTNSKHVARGCIQEVQRIASIPREFHTRGVEDLRNRPAVHFPKLSRVFNGIPDEVDRIKSLGNSIVPHQVYPIYQAIADIENAVATA